MLQDGGHVVTRAFIQSDLAIFLTPVTFGGYSSQLKKAVDHLIPNILPFFRTVKGETRHHKRYAHYPNLLVLGVAPRQRGKRAHFHESGGAQRYQHGLSNSCRWHYHPRAKPFHGQSELVHAGP